MHRGDCIFVPAFYFYQLQGYNLERAQLEKYGDQFDGHAPTAYGTKPVATLITLKYQENSRLLSGFMEAVENKILK